MRFSAAAFGCRLLLLMWGDVIQHNRLHASRQGVLRDGSQFPCVQDVQHQSRLRLRPEQRRLRKCRHSKGGFPLASTIHSWLMFQTRHEHSLAAPTCSRS